MMDIADLEDACLVKLRDMGLTNYQRTNSMLNDSQARNQSLIIDRIHGTLARSNVGPALLWQIQKRNMETTQVLKDMDILDEQINNPEKLQNERIEKYYEFKHSRLSQLTTAPTTSQYEVNEQPLPHENIFERGRPQMLRHSKVNDTATVHRRTKTF